MLVPHIGSVGNFTFSPPFQNVPNFQEFTVLSVKYVRDLENNGLDPLKTVYAVAGLTFDDMVLDSKENVPIVSLEGNGGSVVNIPARYLLSIPKVNGVTYQEKSIMINLGPLPIDNDLSVTLTDIISNVQGSVGVIPTIKVVATSGNISVTKVDHETLLLKRANLGVVNKSFETRYLETKELLDKQKNITRELEEYIKHSI